MVADGVRLRSFDGDADRAFFIDERAEAADGSTVTALIARWMLERHPGASIIHNLITSRAVPETIRPPGGPRFGPGSAIAIKQVMAESGAVRRGAQRSLRRGQLPGRLGDAGNARPHARDVRSGPASLRSASGGGAIPGFGENNFVVSDPEAAMRRVEAMYPDADKDHVDGMTIDLGNVWFNLRPSNTEPLRG